MPSQRRRKPASKKTAAKGSSGRGRRAGSASRAAALRSHAALNRHFASLTPKGSAVRGAADASAGTKKVTFACDNPAVLVTISTQAGALLIPPNQSANLPAGVQAIVWSARGPAQASYNVTVTGGSLDDTITGPLPAGGDGGLRNLTVS